MQEGTRREPAAEVNQLSYEVVNAALEVHRALGPGFLETVYEEALCVELQLRGLPFARQSAISVAYKGCSVGEGRLDILAADLLIVELKAVDTLSGIHSAQVMSYLKATGHSLGLLINFNVPLLRDGIKRIILS